MKNKLFYGWYIIAAAFIILFLSTGTHLSFGVMLKPIATEFGWDRGAISSVYFLNMIVTSTSLVFVGRIYDRVGPKPILIVAAGLLAAGYTLTANITALWQLYISYSVITALGIAGTSVPLMSALIAKWFTKRRGLAVSLTITGASLGQFALVPLLTKITLDYDWRTAYLAVALVSFVVIALLALIVIREQPSDLGLQPYGSGHKTDDTPVAISEDLALGEAMRTRSFWMFLIVMFVCGGGDFFVVTHFIPLVTDYGIDPAVGARMLGLYGLMSLFGLLLSGPLSDKVGNKAPIIITFVIRLPLFILVLNSQTTTAFYVFALGFGITQLMTAPITPTLVGKMYGLTHIGVNMGFILTFHHLSGGLWVYLGGEIFDHTGSYQLVFLISSILAAIGLLASIMIVDKRHLRLAPA
jgi:MFS family permease